LNFKKKDTMKKLIILSLAILIFSCTGDFGDVVNFKEVENPNLSEASVVGQPNSASIWLSGLERQMALVFNETLVLSELGSDNYVNTQTFFNQFMDGLEIQITDPDMRDTQRQIQRLRELAVFGLNEVGPGDPNYDTETEAEFNFFEGLSYLFSGMYFSALPQEPVGVPIASAQHYQNAITAFDAAIAANAKPEYHLAKARANYYLGNKNEAVSAASAALALSTDFDRFVLFDEANGPVNTFESALYQRATFDDLQPLPTLDFLDPKYSFFSTGQDAPVHFLKAEEAYLILAEANLADNDIVSARGNLSALLDLIATREVRTIDDSIEQRSQVDEGSRPDDASVVVNGRSGLVLSRQSGDVDVPSVSGTSLTDADIAAMQDDDAGLALLYRTRQEVFIAEGLRMVDMGVKLVIDENEILLNENINAGDPGTTPVIPSFISAIVDDLDAITYVPGSGVATTAIDLNEVLVANKTSDQVVPFE
jgi:tetratricopeptide (TPR) repeat protein